MNNINHINMEYRSEERNSKGREELFVEDVEDYEVARKEAEKNFQVLMKLIESKHRLPNYKDLSEEYNIGCFQISKFAPRDIHNFHSEVMEKSRHRGIRRNWCQNELRLFVWLLFHYQNAVDVKISEFTREDWLSISSAFIKKEVEDCRFEWLTLTKTSTLVQPWRPEEDQLLANIIKTYESEGRWNEIAKDLFRQSGERFFRKPKQCRERWRNYLDTNINKGQWTREEDSKLMEYVLELGKKWSAISKCMRDRTEHAVKNRYQSLLRRFTKLSDIKLSKGRKSETKKQQTNLIKKICQKLQEDSDRNEESSDAQEALENPGELPKRERLPEIKIQEAAAVEQHPPPEIHKFQIYTMPTPTVSTPSYFGGEAISWVLSPITPIGCTNWIFTPRYVNSNFSSIADWNIVNNRFL